MSDPVILDLLQGALIVAAKIASPVLLASLAIGLLTSLLQAATQLQENVISFVPKIAVVSLTIMMSGHWMLETLVDYGTQVIQTMAEVGAGEGATMAGGRSLDR